MPQATVVTVKKPVPAVYAIAGLLALGGVGLMLLAFRGRDPLGGLNPWRPGEDPQDLRSPNLDGAGQIAVRRGDPFAALRPTVKYGGPGRDVYTYFRIVQNQGGTWVTVYGSGVAGVHVGPPNPGVTSALTEYYLVSPQEVQPNFPACVSQSLCAFPHPGSNVSPICGAPAQPGAAMAVLEIYENQSLSGNPADADGFSSPTCNPRVAILRREYPDKILFV